MNKNKMLSLQAKRKAEIAAKQKVAASGPYELSMIFCVDNVNEVVEEYREQAGLTDAELTPEHVAYSVYQGDLIICLKNLLIPLEQEWHLGVDNHYYNSETEEVKTVPVQFQMPLMHFNEFKFGSTTIKVDRGNGIKTRWKGINEELNSILLADVPIGFERIRSDAKLTCSTGFIDYNCLTEFNFIKRVIRNSGLDGIKKINDAIENYKNQNIEQVA